MARKSLVSFVDGSEGKAVSAAVQANSKYVSGIVSILNNLGNGMSPIAAIAAGIGISESSLKQQERNNGVDPTALNENLRETSPGTDARSLNQWLADAEAESRGGTIPSWALWGIGILGVMILAPGVLGTSLGRRARRSFVSMKMPRFRRSFRMRPLRRRRRR